MVATQFVNGYPGVRVSGMRPKLGALALATAAVVTTGAAIAAAPTVYETIAASHAVVGTAIPASGVLPGTQPGQSAWITDPAFRNSNPVEHENSVYSGSTSTETIAPGSVIGQDADSGTSSERCTVGFVGSVGGRKIAVTAGHCVVSDQGNAVHSYKTKSVVGNYRVWQDEAEDLLDDASGFAVVELAPTVAISAQPSDPTVGAMSGTAIAHTGELVCKLGSSTGLTCGTVAYAADRQLIIQGMNATGGDSGGPVFLKNSDGTISLVGIIEGINDRNGGVAIANPIGNLMDDLKANYSPAVRVEVS